MNTFYTTSTPLANFFHFDKRGSRHVWDEADYEKFPHVIWAADGTTRVARVQKTVVYVAVDEDEYGKPVVEKWKIKRHY